jgi:hypothetical protein
VILLVSRVLDPWLNRTVPVVLYMTEAWGQHAPVFSTIYTIEHLYAFKRTGTAPKHLQHSCVAHLCKTLAGAQKLFKSIVERISEAKELRAVIRGDAGKVGLHLRTLSLYILQEPWLTGWFVDKMHPTCPCTAAACCRDRCLHHQSQWT